MTMNLTNTDFDLITLAQLEKGDVRLYRVRFTNTKQRPQGPNNYIYKSFLKFEPGDLAAYRIFGVAAPEKGGEFGKVVEILEEVKTIEPGIRYNWIVGRVTDYTVSQVLHNRDDELRAQLSMLRAKAEMKIFVEELQKQNLLPIEKELSAESWAEKAIEEANETPDDDFETEN